MTGLSGSQWEREFTDPELAVSVSYLETMLRSVLRIRTVLDFPLERTVCDIRNNISKKNGVLLAGPRLRTVLETD